MSQIAHRIPDATPDNLQNFISDSKWSTRDVMDRVAQQGLTIRIVAEKREYPACGGRTPTRYRIDQQPVRIDEWAKRYWIERTFEDAKGECGMADYEARGWNAWHHHMALVLLAQSFLLDERLLNRDAVPMLSCADLVEILGATLPSKNVSLEEIETAMDARHRKRQQAIDSAYKCQVVR